MNSITMSEIGKFLNMQEDLMADGELPPSLKDYQYIKGFYIDCEEMGEAMAAVLAESIVDYANEYAMEHGYNTATAKSTGACTQVTVMDSEGDLLYQVCYTTNLLKGMNLVMKGILKENDKIMFL